VGVRHIRTVVAVAALASGLAACGGSSSGGTASIAPQTAQAAKDTVAGLSANDHGTKDVSGMSSVDINADNYYFEPSVLHGSAGQKLTLIITNESATGHNFTVKSQNVDSDIDGNKKVTVHVTLPASGVVSFYCEYHKSLGMAGGLLTSGSKSGSAPASTKPSTQPPTQPSTQSGWG
jgi:plastocyanin